MTTTRAGYVLPYLLSLLLQNKLTTKRKEWETKEEGLDTKQKQLDTIPEREEEEEETKQCHVCRMKNAVVHTPPPPQTFDFRTS